MDVPCPWAWLCLIQLLKVQKGNVGLYDPNQMVFRNEFVQREWKPPALEAALFHLE